jgi:hypothetical protein
MRDTFGQARAKHELAALARILLALLDVLIARNVESDDRVRNYLLALDRWTRGEETGPRLGAATRAVGSLTTSDDETTRCFALACHWLADAREDTRKNPGHRHAHTRRVMLHIVDVVECVHGDSLSAGIRAAQMLAEQRRTVDREWIERAHAAKIAQAKRDRVTAEIALGTHDASEEQAP